MIRDPSLANYQKVIKGLHAKWQPHPGQIALGKPLFNEKKDIFGQCGRNFGKTDFVCYALWRYANLHPNSENYYFSPYYKQSKEILWRGGRMPNFGPEDWVIARNDTELRVMFKNGSFIKLDGADNVDAYRGVKPRGLSVYDEFKDFRPEFHEAYDPNRAAFESPLIILGTPPDRECQYLEIANEFRRDPKKHWYHGPSWVNPHLSKQWLQAKRAELEAKGELDSWQREYGAIYVPGGVSKIFPMLNKKIVRPHGDILQEIYRDRRKLEWCLITDPAAASVFAVLFVAVNPYSKKIYALDEIYETDQALMSVDQIGRRIIKSRDELWNMPHESEWRQVYDEAETWFRSEMQNRFNEHFEPTRKSQKKKEDGLSLIRDVLLQGNLVISDRCPKFFWEMDQYFKDKNGNIPKENDHLIDCFRYGLYALHYELNKEKEYIEARDENFRGARISDDFPGLDDMGGASDDFLSDEHLWK